MTENFYDLLGLSPDANLAAINDAYSKLHARYGNDPKHLQKIDAAWRTLSNPFDRGRYDQKLAAEIPAVVEQEREDEQRTFISPVPDGKRRSTEVIDISKRDWSEPAKQRQRKRTDVIIVSMPSRPPPADQSRNQTVEESQSTSQVRKRKRTPTEVIGSQPPNAKKKRISTEVIPTFDPDAKIMPPRREASTTVFESATSYTVLVSYEGREEPFPLQKEKNIIGRPSKSSQPDISIVDKQQYVSRKHALLWFKDGSCVVIDEGSANGTFVNGRRINAYEELAINLGDIISIEGRELRLVVSGEQE